MAGTVRTVHTVPVRSMTRADSRISLEPSTVLLDMNHSCGDGRSICGWQLAAFSCWDVELYDG